MAYLVSNAGDLVVVIRDLRYVPIVYCWLQLCLAILGCWMRDIPGRLDCQAGMLFWYLKAKHSAYCIMMRIYPRETSARALAAVCPFGKLQHGLPFGDGLDKLSPEAGSGQVNEQCHCLVLSWDDTLSWQLWFHARMLLFASSLYPKYHQFAILFGMFRKLEDLRNLELAPSCFGAVSCYENRGCHLPFHHSFWLPQSNVSNHLPFHHSF